MQSDESFDELTEALRSNLSACGLVLAKWTTAYRRNLMPMVMKNPQMASVVGTMQQMPLTMENDFNGVKANLEIVLSLAEALNLGTS